MLCNQCNALCWQLNTNLKNTFFTPTIPLSCGCITLLHFSAELSIFSIFSRVERVAAFSAVAWRWSSTLLGGQRQRHAWPWAHHPLPDKRRLLSSSLSFFYSWRKSKKQKLGQKAAWRTASPAGERGRQERLQNNLKNWDNEKQTQEFILHPFGVGGRYFQ